DRPATLGPGDAAPPLPATAPRGGAGRRQSSPHGDRGRFEPERRGSRGKRGARGAAGQGPAGRAPNDPPWPRRPAAPVPSHIEELIQRSQGTIDFYELVDDILD